MTDKMGDQILGVWKIVSWKAHTAAGVFRSLARSQGDVVEFTMKGHYYSHTNKEKVCRYKSQTRAIPWRLDLVSGWPWTRGRVCNKGIYSIEGHKLTVAFAADGYPRPKRFSPDEAHVHVLEYERLTDDSVSALRRTTAGWKDLLRPTSNQELIEYLSQRGQAVREAEGIESSWMPVGTISVVTGILWAADPCSGWSIEDSSTQVPNGTYWVEVRVMSIRGSRRISRVRARLSDVKKPDLGQVVWRTANDTAHVGIADLPALDEALEHLAADDPRGIDGVWNDVIPHELNEEVGVFQPLAADPATMIYVASGLGDGSWPVHELLDQSRRIGIEIEFIPSGSITRD